jgi:hypothetical protein
VAWEYIVCYTTITSGKKSFVVISIEKKSYAIHCRKVWVVDSINGDMDDSTGDGPLEQILDIVRTIHASLNILVAATGLVDRVLGSHSGKVTRTS